MGKIKILRIIARLNIGGPAIHTILLSSGLDRERYETILVKGQESPHEGDMLYMAKEKGVDPLIIQEMGRELKSRDDIVAFWKIYRLIEKERPLIVHTHTAKAGTLGRFAALAYKVIQNIKFVFGRISGRTADTRPLSEPVIVHTFHGHVLRGYFGGIKSWMFIAIEKFMARFTDCIVTLSEGLKKELIEMGIAPPEKIAIVPLGLELVRFMNPHTLKGTFRMSLGVPEGCILVGIIGRLVPIKGHKIFLEAARNTIRRRAEAKDLRPVRFVIVGDGELYAELKEYAHRLAIEDHLIFTGFRSDLPEIYADLDIVALSSFNEGTPVSLIEAMASGKPVVATDVGGVSDLVRDGITGILVPARDSLALSGAIMRLIEDSDLRKRMGENARGRVYPHYDISNLIVNLDALYGSLLEKRNVPGNSSNL